MFSVSDIWVISPALSLVAIGFLYLALDLSLKRGRQLLGYFVVALMFVPLALSLNLWFGWFGDVPQTGFGGLVAADKFAAFFQILILLLLIAVTFGSIGYLKQLREYTGEFVTLLIMSAAGMLVLVSARELITLYVAFELTALPTTTLIAIRRDRASVEAGVKFLVSSAVGSAFMLFGIVFLYALTGTTFLEPIGHVVDQTFFSFTSISSSTPINRADISFIGFAMIVAGLAFKMSVAPWQLWVPDVYQGAPVPVVAFLSTASKAAAFAALLTILFVGFHQLIEIGVFLGILAAVSMIFGNLGALRQRDIKRLMGYSTVAQAGYILMGTVAFVVRYVTVDPGGESITLNSIGVSSVMFYLASYGATNLAVFCVIMAVVQRARSSDIQAFTGLFYRNKLLALFLVVGLLSLLGLPLTAGFIAKLGVFGASADAGFVWLLVVGVINSVVAAYYYLRVIRQVFSTTDKDTAEAIGSAEHRHEIIVGAVATALVVVIGVVPFFLLDWAREAAESLFFFFL